MEFFVTHQAVDHYSGDCSVAFVLKDKSNENRVIQNYLDLHRFEPKLANTLVLGKVDSKNLQITKDITQILYQIAVSAGVLVGL